MVLLVGSLARALIICSKKNEALNMSDVVENAIINCLKLEFAPLHMEVLNESFKHHVPKGSETHFLVILVSTAFEGQTLIQKQRAVNCCLETFLGPKGPVHALSQKLYTPQQWQALENKDFSTPNCQGW